MSAGRTLAAIPSINRKGSCWDNACPEALFGSLKVERLHGQRFETIRDAKEYAFVSF
jgi:putative transposase